MNIIMILFWATIIWVIIAVHKRGIQLSYRYILDNSEIKVVVFSSFVLMRISYDTIEEIHAVTFAKNLLHSALFQYSPRSCNLCTRSLGTSIFIFKNKGWFREVLISPSDPEEFIVEVKRRMQGNITTA